jgi:dTDP-4-dehydrorhamnose reductase
MISKKKILVTGARGQLGLSVFEWKNAYPQFDFRFFSREEFPIDNSSFAAKKIKEEKPHYLINCAAYTQVDKAESEKDLAWRTNAMAAGNLAMCCTENNCQLIHLSTDYVFDGKATSPYSENDSPSPPGVYGASKLEGEKLVLQYAPGAIIIRSSWVYSTYGKNFVKTIQRLLKEKEKISVVNDQFGSPTYATDLAQCILHVINSNQWQPGIYNYCNEGVISWYDFALAIKEFSGASCEILPISTSEYPTSARRPAYSALDTTKIKTVYSVKRRVI